MPEKPFKDIPEVVEISYEKRYYSDILRNTYNYIIPAYHMNKEHWNTIIIDKNVDETLVKELIDQSYELTR